MDAAIMVIAVSAVARIIRLTVATRGDKVNTRYNARVNGTGHPLVSGLLMADNVAVLAIDVMPALQDTVSFG